MTEETLSDKIREPWEEDEGGLDTKDVKDSIKNIKIKIVENDIYTADEIFRVIDEEVGPKLT